MLFKIIILLVIVLAAEIIGGFYMLKSVKNNIASANVDVSPLPSFTPAAKVMSIAPSPTPSLGIVNEDGKYTLEEVATHKSKADCWMVIEKKVYNVTPFIASHPGGEMILNGCGKDATELFNGVKDHGRENAASLLPDLEVGMIE